MTTQDKVLTKAQSQFKLMIKYGFILILQYTIIKIILITITHFFPDFDWEIPRNLIEDEKLYDIVNKTLSIENIIYLVLVVILSLVTLGKKYNIQNLIVDNPLIKKVSELHSIIKEKVELESEKRRIEGKKFTWNDIKDFVANSIYQSNQELFIEVFKIKNLIQAPYETMSGLLTFMFPLLKDYILGDGE